MTAEVAVVWCSGDLRGDQGSVLLLDSCRLLFDYALEVIVIVLMVQTGKCD